MNLRKVRISDRQAQALIRAYWSDTFACWMALIPADRHRTSTRKAMARRGLLAHEFSSGMTIVGMSVRYSLLNNPNRRLFEVMMSPVASQDIRHFTR